MIIKTIDINAKEWFDKINGNRYFSAVITINYGLKDFKILKVPFEYGYGDHYIDMAFKTIKEELKIIYPSVLWRYCKDNNIILRTNKQTGCLKKDLLT